ncbi:type 1 fimbrial protein [Atlantibacter hermannii]|uniref:type 1 fimbrial protein n=1 Tax=Atlantibacter hermannii TaxID=565 RepID=UPI001934ADCD|nr:type 1 fimbrial protein [Atlantibacter hermannii]MBL7636708.1 type 1 fimbrial protein [Atlantibacter hermannii]MBL7675572.1 type 1 fimbrial protein [Atlantibacter hermannii]MCZ7834918.1 type 1 fimbrial protein [Atlantibacter hermannii]
MLLSKANLKRILNLFGLLLLSLSFCGYSACHVARNDSKSVTTITLPQQILVNSTSYPSGTVLYDSGYITGSPSSLTIADCSAKYYVGFFYENDPQYSPNETGQSIFPTNISGLGVRVYAKNQAGPFDDEQLISNRWESNRSGLISDHTLNGSAYRLQLVTIGGKISSGILELPTALARVEYRENDAHSANGDDASELLVSPTVVNVRALGCSADVSSLTFPLGNFISADFNATGKAGSAQNNITLSCEPGTNVSFSVVAPAVTEGDNANNTAIALSSSGSETVATGVGVQLNLNGDIYDSGTNGLPLNTKIDLCQSSRTTYAEGHTSFKNYTTTPDGCQASTVLHFSANYIKTLPTITAGTANAAGTLNFIYN